MDSADPAVRSDAELALAWRAGEDGAFDEVYRRHAEALFGTAVGLVRDRSGASDVVHDTFLRAATRIAALRDPGRLRAWLFAILRNEAVSWHRSRTRIAGSLDDGPVPMSERLTDDRPTPDVEMSRRELADLVWAAAEGLQARDREVLELHLRGGLEAAELAQVMGVTPGHAAVLLSRMRDRLERCLGAVLVARAGRSDCGELDRLLAGWDGRFSLPVRGTVTRHVESCRVCGRRRGALVSMEHLMPAVIPPVVVLPGDLRLRLVAAFDGLDAASTPHSTPAWAWREDGFPWPVEDPEAPLTDGPPPTRRGTGLLLGVAVLALIIAIGLGVRSLVAEPATTLVDDAVVPTSPAAYPSLPLAPAGSFSPGDALPTAAGAVAAAGGSAAAAPSSPVAGAPGSASPVPSVTRVPTPTPTVSPSPIPMPSSATTPSPTRSNPSPSPTATASSPSVRPSPRPSASPSRSPSDPPAPPNNLRAALR